MSMTCKSELSLGYLRADFGKITIQAVVAGPTSNTDQDSTQKGFEFINCLKNINIETLPSPTDSLFEGSDVGVHT